MNRVVLIGNEVDVIGSSNPAYIGIKGTIIDETTNMIIIEDKRGLIKRLIKKNIIIEINGVQIDGMTLIGRPENRIKNRIKRKWR
ncbi:MAG: ribonuclease P protein subunit [Candidatus Methanofastidiosia archaeon]